MYLPVLCSLCIAIRSFFRLLGRWKHPLNRPQDLTADEKDRFSTVPDSTPTCFGLPLSVTQPGCSQHEETGDTSLWVINLTRYICHKRHGSRYNVLTLNPKIDYYFRSQGVIEKISLNYENPTTRVLKPYEVTVFRQGTFINLRDGQLFGWGNAYAEGNFSRYGEVMNFRPVGEVDTSF